MKKPRTLPLCDSGDGFPSGNAGSGTTIFKPPTDTPRAADDTIQIAAIHRWQTGAAPPSVERIASLYANCHTP